ncbi:unnamed protein product [Closterium sp. NIES-65]|nr:unnamed protein product [Closterium sp. NIES-65]
MATPSVLTYDAEGRALDFEVWVDDLQLFLQCDRADGLSLFDLTSGASPVPPTDADSTVRSQWATRDVAAHLAVRRHLPTTERAHFSQYKSAKTLDHFLSVCPTTLTVDLLEERLLAIEKSIVAVGASRGDPRTSVFEGCSPSPLLPSVASTAAADLVGFESAVEGVGVVVGVVAGEEVSVAVVETKEAAAGAEVAKAAEVAEAAAATEELVAALRRGVVPVVVSASSESALVRPRPPQQLREWYTARQRGGGAGPCAYVLRTGDSTGEPCGGPHTTQRCFGRLTDAWRLQFPDATEIPRWGELLRAGVAIFDLDYDAILAAMYFVSTSDEGDCYLYVPPDPRIEAAALGACEAAALGASASAAPGAGESALSGTTSAQALHTFTVDSGASRSFFRDRTTLTPLSRPLRSPWRTPLGVLSLLASPLSYRVRQPPLAPCQVSTFPRSLRTW